MTRREEGFTLIEAVIATAIMSVVIAAIAMTTTTIMANSALSADRQFVMRQVQNAGYRIACDVQMADNVTFSTGGFPLTLNIPVDTDDNNDGSAVYYFDGDKLKRQLYDSTSTLIGEALIADDVLTDNTTFSTQAPDTYLLTIRASRSDVDVLRSYEIVKRIGTR